MCGIAGVVAWGGAPDRAHLESMASALTHRGPDDQGLFIDGPCGLAFRRLAILDLATGHQPMTSGEATVVFNGELYNYRELRAELTAKGHAFRTTSDTEVLLQAYRAWGEAAVERLDGMFAFALWDAKQRRLWLARDRFGKKPLYYASVGKTFLFASELKALLRHPLCPREVSPASVRRYLAFEYVPTPGTIFQGVRQLSEAHAMTVEDGTARTRRYFQLPPPPDPGTMGPNLADAVDALREKLGHAVRRRLVADVPVGVFLSGGVDSTAVVAFATRGTARLKTFSMAFDEPGFDESAHARHAARTFGTDHAEARVSAGDCLALIPQAAEQLDEPLADPSYFPTHLLSVFTRRSVTVALGGDGADELFAGYDSFLADAPGRAAWHLPTSLQTAMAKAAAALPSGSGYMSWEFRLKAFLKGAGFAEPYRHQAWIGALTPDAVERLLAPAWRSPGPSDVYGDIDAFATECPARGIDFALRYYLSFYLRDDILTKVDRASMAASLEVRSPFLDTELASWVSSLPAHFKLHRGQRKWLLKQALRGIVPDSILDRPKHGFALPVAAWLKGPLKPLVEDLLSQDAVAAAGIFEPREVERFKQEHFDGRADHRKPLWALLMFELWRRRWGRA